MARIHIPTADEFASQLSTLIGRDVSAVEPDEKPVHNATSQSAIYLTRDDRLALIARLDLAIAAHLGAALCMMPLPSSEEAIGKNKLDGDLLDAYGEVVNIMASLFCAEGAPHVRLSSVNECDPDLEDQFMQTLTTPETRMDLQVDIDGYGPGIISIWTANLDLTESA